MAVSTRRAALGAILAAPLASVPAVADDPHGARLITARALYRRHRESEWGWSEPNFSPPDIAAGEAHGDLCRFGREACDLPLPTTMAGLGSLALTIALSEEGAYGERHTLDADELMLVTLVHAVLSLTGTALPADFRGFCYVSEEGTLCA